MRTQRITLDLDASQLTDLLNAVASWSNMQAEAHNRAGSARTLAIHNEIATQTKRHPLKTRAA